MADDVSSRSAQPGLVDAGPAADYRPGVPRLLSINGKEVGVVRWGDRFFAIWNHCPDQGGPLCAGTVRALLAGGLSGAHVHLSLDEARPTIACPWHHYEFDLETGRELRGGGRKAITYPVEVRNGRVYVKSGRAEHE
ncbi:MAG: hypothetical protein DLM67_18160 [Candidatus Nephthysia bennettiae]|uniref:Nitrite reductase (NAD(P)H) small subunit n=1 Tax=Candidatus Nephthysia bennettiae TaxID=3127016 RepID=A0A934K3U5_9BACT|nr:nitrite reductase (NAD(P)H) small subunit [Candidatus Dormibacteraeota bacterium]MBJ7614047.1 nitrite reductase (NAD(P)H) small subunit [Candidatus Dormibacteraeota bacterium]PZR90111.1 MAG: hypothetical protein DLM67_18160 [Candidatus Dormibacteraeota bacterium]